MTAPTSSVNSPALERPEFITQLAEAFGTQCVVVGSTAGLKQMMPVSRNMLFINTLGMKRKPFPQRVTRSPGPARRSERGAGEIVLNCMNNDGVKRGYDLISWLWFVRRFRFPSSLRRCRGL